MAGIILCLPFVCFLISFLFHHWLYLDEQTYINKHIEISFSSCIPGSCFSFPRTTCMKQTSSVVGGLVNNMWHKMVGTLYVYPKCFPGKNVSQGKQNNPQFMPNLINMLYLEWQTPQDSLLLLRLFRQRHSGCLSLFLYLGCCRRLLSHVSRPLLLK